MLASLALLQRTLPSGKTP